MKTFIFILSGIVFLALPLSQPAYASRILEIKIHIRNCCKGKYRVFGVQGTGATSVVVYPCGRTKRIKKNKTGEISVKQNEYFFSAALCVPDRKGRWNFSGASKTIKVHNGDYVIARMKNRYNRRGKKLRGKRCRAEVVDMKQFDKPC